MKYDVYLAAPWFHEGEPERLDKVEACLDSFENLKVFSPRRETLVDAASTDDKLEQSFLANVRHVKASDFVVAIVSTKDSGTLFECGLAYGCDVPILYYYDTPDKPFNLMLAKSCKQLGYVTNVDELKERIQTILDLGIDNVNVEDFKGEIE